MGKDKVGAHGLKRSEMKELHLKQNNGEAPEMVAANGKEANGYKIRKDEAHLVHVELEMPRFDPNTGARQSKPFPQNYSVKDFEAAKLNNGFSGYTVKVLHAPEEAKARLGAAALEGAKEDTTNYALMRERFEVLTKQPAPADWTESQLDAAIRFAEQFPVVGAGSIPAPIKASEIEPNRPPVVLGTPAAAALAAETNPNPENKEQLAAAATEAGNNHAPSNDGATSVGQGTEARPGVEGRPETQSQGEQEEATGRRGARPADAVKKPAQTAEEKAAAKAAKAPKATSAARE